MHRLASVTDPKLRSTGGDGADVGVLAMSKSEQFREYAKEALEC